MTTLSKGESQSNTVSSIEFKGTVAEEYMIAILRVAAKIGGEDALTATRSSVAKLERLGSLDDLLRIHLPVQKVFDETNLLMALWLPVSRRAGCPPQITPNFPVLPAVTAARQQNEVNRQ